MSDEPMSYPTGRWGVSRVRVYQRYPGGPFQVTGTGLKRQTLRNLSGKPVYDPDLAVRIANTLAQRMEEGAHQETAREVLGLPERKTVRELTERYHGDLEGTWSPDHLRIQRQLRAWWEEALGPDTDLRQVGAASVEGAVREAAEAHGWSRRTRQKYLRYPVALWRYAARKLKWVPREAELTDVDLPSPGTGGPSYSRAEIHALREVAPDVDLRTATALDIAYITLARSRAILGLRTGDYLGEGRIQFWREKIEDQEGRVAVLTRRARATVERLLEERPPREWLIETDAGTSPGYKWLLGKLRDVEKAAGVDRIEGRGWHAVKRRAVTDFREAAGEWGPVAQQGGTDEETMERIYLQLDLDRIERVAEAVEVLGH